MSRKRKSHFDCAYKNQWKHRVEFRSELNKLNESYLIKKGKKHFLKVYLK